MTYDEADDMVEVMRLLTSYRLKGIDSVGAYKEFRKLCKSIYAKGRNRGIEESALALNPLYIMKGSENDGMRFIPDCQEAIWALKSQEAERGEK